MTLKYVVFKLWIIEQEMQICIEAPSATSGLQPTSNPLPIHICTPIPVQSNPLTWTNSCANNSVSALHKQNKFFLKPFPLNPMISWPFDFYAVVSGALWGSEGFQRFVACTSQSPTPGNLVRKMTPIIDRRQLRCSDAACRMMKPHCFQVFPTR